MAAIMKDNVIYDELWNKIAPMNITKGEVGLFQEVYGFAHNSGVIGDEICVVYKCRQVRVDKKLGSGEAIISGDQIFYDLILQNCSPTKGMGMVFIGWAKEDADENAADVLINFDGTLWQLI